MTIPYTREVLTAVLHAESTFVTSITLGLGCEPRPELAKHLRLGTRGQLLVLLEDLEGDLGELVSDLIAGQVGSGPVLEGIDLVEYLVCVR